MPKEAVFTMKLEAELRAEFVAEAEALDHPASQVVRELMREFVRRQREARAHEEFVSAKVAMAREDVRAGRYRPSADVEWDFSARRAELLRKAGA